MLYGFIWQSKVEKIKRLTLIGDFNKGGLKMVDIRERNKVFKIMWMVRLVNETGSWKEWIVNESPLGNVDLIKRANVRDADLKLELPKGHMWNEVLITWCIQNYKGTVAGKENILDQMLWLNSNIKRGKNILLRKKWIENGILRVAPSM